MPDIRILSENLSNKIAAGEVVARPASVVKELLENSIDAKASNITLEVENGGRTLIRVSDNGTGMTRDNALLSIERFATSKIQDSEDLFSIATMGFRGEAIPSIASVSRFSLITREKDNNTGTNIIISGGKLMNVTDTGAPPGTMVQVKNLFFNTPARKKFLKTYNTEMSHVADTFSSIALGNPGLGFRLFNSGKLLKNFAASDSLYERVLKVLGKDLSSNLLEVDNQASNIHVSGFISSPKVTRSSSRMIKVFVNNRLVSNRGVTSAIFNGYRGNIMKSRFPLAVLYINLPFDNVDINVHPAKNEVRFFDGKSVYNVVAEAVKQGLRKDKEQFYKEPVVLPGKDSVKTDSIRQAVEYPDVKESPLPEIVQEPLFKYTKPDRSTQESFPRESEPPVEEHSHEDSSREGISDYKGDSLVKGQVMSTYIVAETDDGMILVDQHAAHERIVYEKFKYQNQSSPMQSQVLLMPETLELGFREADLLLQIIEELSNYGFDIEPFGGTTFIVKAVPAIIDKKEAAPFIIEIIDSLADKKTSAPKNQWLDDILILMACHSAIRAKQRLNFQEMEQLLTDLKNCENPLHCPHGRPTMIKWGKKDLEKIFKRIV